VPSGVVTPLLISEFFFFQGAKPAELEKLNVLLELMATNRKIGGNLNLMTCCVKDDTIKLIEDQYEKLQAQLDALLEK